MRDEVTWEIEAALEDMKSKLKKELEDSYCIDDEVEEVVNDLMADLREYAEDAAEEWVSELEEEVDDDAWEREQGESE